MAGDSLRKLNERSMAEIGMKRRISCRVIIPPRADCDSGLTLPDQTAQGKLVRRWREKILDVAVEIDARTADCWRWERRFCPRQQANAVGFGGLSRTGFRVISETARCSDKATEYYARKHGSAL